MVNKPYMFIDAYGLKQTIRQISCKCWICSIDTSKVFESMKECYAYFRGMRY